MLAGLFEKWVAKRRPIGKELIATGKTIYIIPTKQGMAFIIMVVLILMVGINYQNNLSYGLCFLLGSIMFLSIIHTWRNLVNLRVMNMGADPVFAEDMACFKVRLEAQYTRQSIAIGWSSETKGLQLVDVDVLSGAEVLLTKHAPKRGIFSPGKIHIETQFPLGLFVAWMEMDLLLSAIAYPKPVKDTLPTIAQPGDDEEEGLHSSGRGVEDFQGLRSYQAGDSKKLISWKSFSRGQGLFVKDFSALLGKDPWLDYDAVSGDIEHRLSVLCYWVLFMTQENRPYGFKLGSFELKPSQGEKQKNSALYALAMYGIRQ